MSAGSSSLARRRLLLWGTFCLMLWQSAYYRPLLPETVAAHFDLSGEADGWASKDMHLGLMLLAGAAVVAMFEGLAWLLPRLPASSINLPHREHWLAPERRGETIAALRSALIGVGALTMAWLAVLNEIVLRSNLGSEPRLGASFWASLIAFLLFLALGLASFSRRFSDPPEER